MIQAWLAKTLGGKAAGLIWNKWTAILLIVGSLAFSTWWYRDTAQDLKAENDVLVVNVETLKLAVGKLKDNVAKTKADYEYQLRLVDHIRNVFDETQKDYHETRKELEQLQGYLEALPKELENAENAEVRQRIVTEANNKVQVQINKSLNCIVSASKSQPCGE